MSVFVRQIETFVSAKAETFYVLSLIPQKRFRAHKMLYVSFAVAHCLGQFISGCPYLEKVLCPCLDKGGQKHQYTMNRYNSGSVSTQFFFIYIEWVTFSLLMVPLGTVVFLNPTNSSSLATDLNTLAEKFSELGLAVGV
jgi:hypothetical protein